MSARLSYPVLLSFAFGEVLQYEQPPYVQLPFSILAYVFLAIQSWRNPSLGVAYYIAFTLSAMGGWSYVVVDQQPYTFWGLRLFGVSANLIFSVALAGIVFVKHQGERRLIYKSNAYYFFFYASLYALLVGVARVALADNYFDNLVGDLAVFAPLVLYFWMIQRLDATQVSDVVCYGISASILSMAFSSLIGRSFNYGDDYRFALVSGFGYISVFFVPFMYKRIAAFHYIALFSISVLLVATGNLFIGGKAIVVAALASVWAAVYAKRATALALFCIGLLIALTDVLGGFASRFLEEGSLTAYKFSQATELFEAGSLEELSMSRTSVGNLAAEARTISRWIIDRPFSGGFGQGFGAAIPDYHGLLSPLAGPGAGYRIEDAVRDSFSKMHLPLYNFVTRIGVLGAIGYCMLLAQYLSRRNPEGMVAFIVLSTVVTNSKEMALLAVLFLYASDKLTGEVRRTVVPGHA